LTCDVKFTPAAGADRSAKLTIESDDLKHPTVDITLSGCGIEAVKPPPPPRRITAVGAKIAVDHTAAALVARSDGTLWYRQSRSVYQQVHGLSEVQAVAASAKQSAPGNRVYVITNDGSLLALNGIVGRREKVLDGVIDVSAGWDHALALKEDGRVFALATTSLGSAAVKGIRTPGSTSA